MIILAVKHSVMIMLLMFKVLFIEKRNCLSWWLGRKFSIHYSDSHVFITFIKVLKVSLSNPKAI